MTNTRNRAAGISNDSANRLTDAAYAQSATVCRRCGERLDTAAKANATCEATGKRHFGVSTR